MRAPRRSAWARLGAAALALACALAARPASAATVDFVPDKDALSIRILPADTYPPHRVTDLEALPGAEGQVMLLWTVPDESTGVARKGIGPVSYDLRYASFSAVAIGGNAETWFGAATPVAPQPAVLGVPGDQISYLTSLEPGGTFCFGMKSTDDAANTSFVDERAAGGATQACAPIKGVEGVTDLTALGGPATGEVSLTWTAPRRNFVIAPVKYQVRVSSKQQIATDAQFNDPLIALPLSALSGSPIPAVAAAGAKETLTVTGLLPSATYYFAVRALDSDSVPLTGRWLRDELSRNTTNFARGFFAPGAPEAITNLSALPDAQVVGGIDLSWTVPATPNQVPITSFVIRYSTVPITAAPFLGDATAWFNLAPSTQIVVAPTQPVGGTESLLVTTPELTKQHCFSIRSINLDGQSAPIDSRSTGGSQPCTVPGPFPPIIDLSALPGTGSGEIALAWTAPPVLNATLPLSFVVRVSTTQNIANNADFENPAVAKPITAFTSAPFAPPPGDLVGGPKAMLLSGLDPTTTFYFAVRERDSSNPPVINVWQRSVPSGFNVNNFARPFFVPADPEPVTDLSAATGAGAEGSVDLAWTAPLNTNGVPISTYTVRFASFPIAEVGGSTAAWYQNAATTERVFAPAKLPGFLENFTVTGLEPGVFHYFALKAIDKVGATSAVDTRAVAVVSQASAPAKGVAGVTDLAAIPGAAAGSVDLSWTEPRAAGISLPSTYTVVLTTTGNIADNAAFAAAKPLTAFSLSPAPALGAVGAPRLFTITGLPVNATYYFALRAEDSSAPALKGRWLREAVTAPLANVFNFSAPRFTPNPPDPITNLSALPGALEGEVALSWTAPRNQNFVPINSYELRFSTVSAAAAPFAGDAEAWFAAHSSSRALLGTAQQPGAVENLLVPGLYPASTFYFGIKAIDAFSEIGLVDSRAAGGNQAFVKPLNLAPATPTGLTGLAGLLSSSVVWDELPPAGRGLDFSFFRLVRSTASDFSGDLVQVTTSAAATSVFERPLDAFKTLFYRVSARDAEGLESAPSAGVPVTPFTIPPMQPFGVDLTVAGDSVTISWAPTARFEDTTPFVSTGAPRADELTGYLIFRTTDLAKDPQLRGSVALSTRTFTDDILGLNQTVFYTIRSSNTVFASTDSVFITAQGEQFFLLADRVSRLQVPTPEVRSTLIRSDEGAPDILINRRFVTEETGGKVLSAVEYKPMAEGVTPVKDFAFSKPATVVMRIPTNADGSVKLQAAKDGSGFGAAALGTQESQALIDNLGIFWHDGVEYRKLYGDIDKAEKVVRVQTPNIGSFQLRTVVRESGVTFDLSNITSRVITPNGDGKNDLILFLFDNPRNVEVTGTIYDIRGMTVAQMQPGPMPNTLQWDGRMNGQVVTSGVYVYQVKGEGKVFNGTIVVAR